MNQSANLSEELNFEGAGGATLSARLDLPDGPPRAYALFAHCFTCSKDFIASRTVSRALTDRGFGVLRFDFTGLGSSQGDFASTNFTMNLGDLRRAVELLRDRYEAPQLLVGHSMGGAAILAIASDVPEAKAVATIAAPSDVGNVKGRFMDQIDQILREGSAEVQLAGRPFRIERQFVEDLDRHDIVRSAGSLQKALLILHAPGDDEVSVDHATALWRGAAHPKSFVTLDTANHLLSKRADATYAAGVIAAWAERYIEGRASTDAPEEAVETALSMETGAALYQNRVTMGDHHLIADEPVSIGGLDTGPAPYDLLCAALATCTSITLRMYAERKSLDLAPIGVGVRHEKKPGEGGAPGQDLFRRRLVLPAGLDTDVRDKLLEIANKCPVHRTLEAQAEIETIADDMETA